MKRLGLLIALLAGCSGKPCATTSDCGNGEVCAAARCAALSCSDTWFAVDPSSGQCTPLSGCIDPASVAGWQPCNDPCSGQSENQCLQDSRCQATYTGSPSTPVAFGGAGGGPAPVDAGVATPPSTGIACAPGVMCGGGSGDGTFRSCQPVPAVVDPCKALDATQCTADSRCEVHPTPSGSGCGCGGVDGGVCNCPPIDPTPLCGLKQCGELTNDQCKARPDCTTTQPAPVPLVAGSHVNGGSTPARGQVDGCFPVGNCFGDDEHACRATRTCRPLYDDGGKYSGCEPQSFVRHCSRDADCDADERCNGDKLCVTRGCAGENEAECNADPECEAIYSLQCSPYANGPGGFCGGGVGPTPTTGGAPATPVGGCGCEPSFTGCAEHGDGCDPDRSILVRNPAILDDPFWAFPRILAAVTGAAADDVADAWLPTIGVDTVVDGKTASGRAGAAAFIAALPRDAAGKIDASRIGFQPTSLSNRIDLADGTSCGEARITYALTTGVNDRRHRMTVIFELMQPDDGAGCVPTARRWLALGSLDGAALEAALQAIYAPILNPTDLKQIRTNEFLVGPQDPSQKPAAWELREFHVGADARLHETLLPLQIDQAGASDANFVTWAETNRTGLTNGTVQFPTQYRLATASEDGSQLTVSDGTLTTLVNQQTCAGCHTTATNSAFAHVGERMQPGWRAQISQFVEQQLDVRAQHLVGVAFHDVPAILPVRPMH